MAVQCMTSPNLVQQVQYAHPVLQISSLHYQKTNACLTYKSVQPMTSQSQTQRNRYANYASQDIRRRLMAVNAC